MKILKDEMMIGIGLSMLFYTYSAPTIMLWYYHSITENQIAFFNTITAISGVVIGAMWIRYEKTLISMFPHFCLWEIVINTLVCVVTLLCNKPTLYYIISGVAEALITRNIICGINVLKAKRYEKEERGKVDTIINNINFIAILVGNVLLILIKPTLKISMICFVIGLSIDNLIYSHIYYKEIYYKK